MSDRAGEQQRPRERERFRELVEGAPEPIGVLREGRLVYANPACLSALGFDSAEDAYSRPLATLLDEEAAAIRASRDPAVLEQGARPPPETYRVQRPDGSAIMLEVSSVYLEFEGKPSVLFLGRDVTARKQLDSRLVQADRLAALGTMAAGVAHEINNPLAYVMLNLEWIARKLPHVAHDPGSVGGLMDMLEEARQGAERVSSIVRELRSFSRADGESRRYVELASVVQSAVKIVGHEIRHRARVTMTFDPARPVWANEGRLEQVVINLLLNAAQAMPEARAEQNEIRVSVRPEGDAHAVLEVADNGEGIPPEVQARIFDPFYSTKPVGVGTGLGLSICHGIVSSLGGTITAYSEPGEGTSFRVVLPTNAAYRSDPPPPSDQAPSVGTAEAVPAASARRAVAEPSARVLVVDDEPQIGTALRELLAPDHDVVSANTSREALAVLATDDQFDVIFCDLMMPGMSGIDLYQRIRVDHPGVERRIVFMTGGAFTSRAAEFLAAVDNRRVEKPFSLGLIEKIVREMARARSKATR